MPDFMDVDTFLNKDDLKQLDQLRWPWKKTHFILSDKCNGCGLSTNDNSNRRRFHFVLPDNKIKHLLNTCSFWCRGCAYFAVYDHFTNDECYYCN